MKPDSDDPTIALSPQKRTEKPNLAGAGAGREALVAWGWALGCVLILLVVTVGANVVGYLRGQP